MKKYTYVLLLLVFGSSAAFAQTPKPTKDAAQASEVKTEEREKFDPMRVPADDLKLAMAAAQSGNKRIILDVGGEWCGWCRFMDKFFINNPELAKLRDENFVWVKINFSEENENKAFLSAYPAAQGYPHLFVLEADGKLLHSQNTGELEDKKGYDLQKFTDFITKWSPPKSAAQ